VLTLAAVAMPCGCRSLYTAAPQFGRDRGAVRGVHRARETRRARATRGDERAAACWATGYCVSAVGPDQGAVRQYTREQEELDSGRGRWDVE
jgi:hypothetical protein